MISDVSQIVAFGAKLIVRTDQVQILSFAQLDAVVGAIIEQRFGKFRVGAGAARNARRHPLPR